MNENIRILKPFLRGFPIIIFCMFLGVVAAKKYLGYVTPMYESTSKLKLADVHDGVPGSNLFKDFDVFANSSKIAAEIELIKSATIVSKALDSLDFDIEIYRIGKIRSVELYHESPFSVTISFNNPKGYNQKFGVRVVSAENFVLTIPGSGKQVEGTFGTIVPTEYGQVLISLNEDFLQSRPNAALIDAYEFECLSREKLIEKVVKNLDIAPIDKEVAVIRITFQSPVPDKAAALVNLLGKVYIYDYIDSKYKAASTTVKFLDKQIADVTTKLSGSENKIENYRDRQKITNIRQETETDLRSVAQLKIQLTNEKMNVQAMDELNRYIQSGKDNFLELAPNFEAFTDLLSTEIVKNIKKLQADKKDLLITYTPEEERVKVIDRKIDDLKNYLIESISNTRRNHEVKYERLKSEIIEAEKAFIGVPGKEKVLNIMNRDFDLYQQSYNFLNEKKIEAEIAQAARISFHRMIEEAVAANKPVSPNRSIIIIVSAILCLIGSSAMIYLVHTAKAKVNDAVTIERNSTIPVVAEVPMFTDVLTTQKYFHKMMVQLELKKLLPASAVIVISSYREQEGKRFTTVKLAGELTRQGKKVLIVDMDYSITSVPAGITLKQLTTAEMEVLNSAVLEETITAWKQEFDIILIKNESLELSQNGLLLMSVADTNLLMTDSRRTPAKYVMQAELLKEEYQFPNLHFVLNRAGYNPNILVQGWGYVQVLRSRFLTPTI
jgi:uncharacterized protein involved in exopolysaccharide biosynthesis